MRPRTILHVDMDAFFAAIEQRDDPALRGRPVLVGGSPEGRGVVSTASYEARVFGCHSAQPMAQALRLCPDAIVVRPRMARYAEVSQQVATILERRTPVVEPLSIDEAFLDVSGSLHLFGDGPTIARQIKEEIHAATGLTASVGVAPSKFVAKLASDLHKPDGLVVVREDEVDGFLAPLPIGRLWGVGRATLPRFEALGVQTFADARRLSLAELRGRFGEVGARFYDLVRGLDPRAVVADRRAVSISHETTFARDVQDPQQLRNTLLELLDQVAARLRRTERQAWCVVLKVRTPDFATHTRRVMLREATNASDALWQPLSGLLDDWLRRNPPPLRLIGAAATQLTPVAPRQLGLFDAAASARHVALDQAIDRIRERFGPGSLRRGTNTPPRDPPE